MARGELTRKRSMMHLQQGPDWSKQVGIESSEWQAS